ncbi:MAG: UbiA family prenyltransferase, partial [Candidatus Micrarchaeia archaeon]
MATEKGWKITSLSPEMGGGKIPLPSARLKKSKYEKPLSRGPGLLTTLSAVLRLVRFEHALMFALSVFIAEVIASSGIPAFTLVLLISLMVPVLSEMAAFALNDLLDMRTDRINKKEGRPLVSGELTPNFALALAAVSLAGATVLSYLISMQIFILTLAINALALLYNAKLKDLPLAGNLYIAFTMGIPFLFGNLAVSPVLSAPNIFIALMGFLAGLAREIVKTCEDVEGDARARKSKTLPMLIGMKPSLWLAGIIYALFVLCSIVPFHLYLKVGIGFAVVLAADLIFGYSSLMLIFSRHRLSFLATSRKIT